MAISDDMLEQVLSSVENEEFRRRLREALTREYTQLSEIGHQIFQVTGAIDDVELDRLHAADPEVVAEELRRCEIALARLSLAFTELTQKLAA